MAQKSTLVDRVIESFTSPPDDPAGRARALASLRAWHLGIENHDFALLESLMHDDIVIQLPFSESGRTDEAISASTRARQPAWSSGALPPPSKASSAPSPTWT